MFLNTILHLGMKYHWCLYESYYYKMIQIDVKVGDTILMGRFKNKKVVVKTITYDEHGMPVINGKPACTFRLNNKK